MTLMFRFNILTASLLTGILSLAQAQNSNRPHPMVSTNFGLTAPQDPATLPKSKVPVVMPTRVAKVDIETKMVPKADKRWTIENGWELAEANALLAVGDGAFAKSHNDSVWYNATVPGTVLTTLVNQGVYPDPYYNLNNMAIPESLCRTDWWYKVDFAAPKKQGANRAWLLFNGINYRADVWLNGKLIGDIKGAFIRGRFDVTDILQDNNTLAVHIFPPANPGIPHEQSTTALRGPNGGQMCLDGPTFLSSEGWDWIPGMRDRNAGIWRDVVLEYTNDVSVGDCQVVTDIVGTDLSRADITIKTELKNSSNTQQHFTLKGVIEDISFAKEFTLAAGESKKVLFTPQEFAQLKMNNPRLWWPNGYGEQNLYKMTLTLTDSNGSSVSKQVRFGIRELSYEITVDTPSKKERRIDFNPIKDFVGGKPVFDAGYQRKVGSEVVVPCLLEGVDENSLTEIADNGTAPYLVFRVNGVPIFCKGGNWGMDDGMKRVSRERLEPYLKLHKDANYNMIRNWTGECTEDVFYELCDEYGMLVWNDFWISTEGYNHNPNDEDLFMANVTDVVKRFANHPSIALWCPRNEGYATPSLEKKIRDVVASQDGTRLYHGNSRYLNLRGSGGWYYITDQTDYFKRQAHGFNTELGTGAVPTAESMRKFIPEEDLWPIGSDSWHYHDLHFGLETYCKAIDSLYGASKNIDEFCRKAQMVNYDSHRAMFEAWNSKMWSSTSGLLLWMTHPAWPSVVWQTYSWDYETFGAYFGCRTGCEPLHIQMNLDNNNVCVVNASNRAYQNLTASLVCMDMNGKALYKKEIKLSSVAANKLTECFVAQTEAIKGVYIARVELKNGREVLSVNDYIKSGVGTTNLHSLNDLSQASVKARIMGAANQGEFTIELSNPSATAALAVKLNLRDRNSGEAVLPAFFSQGYFNLMPGQKKIVTVQTSKKGNYNVSAEGYNMPRSTIADVKL